MTLDLDHSYVGPYLQDWLRYVRESNEAELDVISNGQEFRMPYSGVPTEMMKAIFVISSRYKIDPEAKYMAVHLLDRYMGIFFYELMAGATELTENSMRQMREKMLSQMKLILATCVQIASKIDLFRTCIGISQIQDVLQSIDPGRTYSTSTISNCELRILKALDFRMPACLPIHVVQLLLVYSDLTFVPHIHDTCINLLDIAYLFHDEIFEQLHVMARGCKYDKSSPDCRDFLKLEANAAFLGASVVVCSNFFFPLKKRIVGGLTSKLADLIEMSPIDINIMANILFTFAIDEDDFKELQQKTPQSDED